MKKLPVAMLASLPKGRPWRAEAIIRVAAHVWNSSMALIAGFPDEPEPYERICLADQ